MLLRAVVLLLCVTQQAVSNCVVAIYIVSIEFLLPLSSP